MRIADKRNRFPLSQMLICIGSTVVLVLGSFTANSWEYYKEDEIFSEYTNEYADYGGTFRIYYGSEIRSFDPHTGTATHTADFVNKVYNGLLRQGPRIGEIELDLARSWRQIDDVTYEFKLHEGIRFHDIPPVNGREMTSTDVKYSIERVAGMHGKKSVFKHAYYFDGKIDSIETPDKYTVIFKTKGPYAPFVNYIASNWSKVVPKEAVDLFGDLRRNAIGTGAFYLKEHEKGNHILLNKHPDYFKEGLPYLDAVRINIIRNPKAAVREFIQGKLDYIRLHPAQIEVIKKQAPNSKLFEATHLFTWTLRTPPWVEGRIQPKDPFGDRRVRQAIAYAIDKKRLINWMEQGAGIEQVGPIPRNFSPWGLQLADQWEYNPAKARKLLIDAGYPDGFDTEIITIDTPYLIETLRLLQQMLSEIGINAQTRPLTFAEYYNRIYRFKYELALHIIPAGYDPSEWLVPYFGKHDTSTYYKWSNKELWQLIEEQEKMMDRAERMELVDRIQKLVMEEAMSQSLYSQARVWAVPRYIHMKWYYHPTNNGISEHTWMEIPF